MDPTNHESRNGHEELPTRAARLMAYLDGELAPEEGARIEAWIAQDPEAHHQHEEERRRRELFAQASIPEPDARMWDDTLANIERAVFAPKPVVVRPRSRSTLWVVVGVTAAAVIAAIWIRTSGLLDKPVVPDQPRPVIDMLDVATAADVVIEEMDPADARYIIVGTVPENAVSTELRAMRPFDVSAADDIVVETIDGADTDRLVMGELPVEGRLMMAIPGEVAEVIIKMRDKQKPQPYLLEPNWNGGMPMINVQLKAAN